MATWRYILAGLNGDEKCEIWQASNRQVSRPLAGGAGAGVASMMIDLDNPAVSSLLGTGPVDRLELILKAYRNSSLMFCGDVFTGEIAASGNDQTFALSAVGPLVTRANGRLLGKTVAGYGDGTVLAQKDLGQMILNTLSVLNSEFDTGIRAGAVLQASSSGFLDRFHFKKAGELWMELSQGLGGPDLALDPVEPVSDALGTRICDLNIYGALGATQPTAIFEYGSGKRNIQSWRQPFDTSGMANKVYHLPPGFPDAIGYPRQVDGVSGGVFDPEMVDPGTETPHPSIIIGTNTFTVNRRRREELVGQGDLSVTLLRQKLVDLHARIRGYPRETVFFTPIPDCDVQYGTHYKEGDLVVGRATSRGGRVLLDAVFRVFGVDFTVDATGLETIELALINEGAQV